MFNSVTREFPEDDKPIYPFDTSFSVEEGKYFDQQMGLGPPENSIALHGKQNFV